MTIIPVLNTVPVLAINLVQIAIPALAQVVLEVHILEAVVDHLLAVPLLVIIVEVHHLAVLHQEVMAVPLPEALHNQQELINPIFS